MTSPYSTFGGNGGGGGGGSVSDATSSSKGIVQLAGDLGGTAALPTVPGLSGKAPVYATQSKTASFTAAPWNSYLVDSTAGAVTVTLPPASAGGQFAVKWVAGANPVTLQRAGSDTIGTTGATTATLALANEIWEFLSDGATAWNLIGGNKTLASLDGRFVKRGDLAISARDYGATGDGSTDDTAALQNAVNAAATLGAALFLPPGTYMVAPDATYKVCLRLPAGLTGLYGDGATIKVKAGVGNYFAVLANTSSQGGGFGPNNVNGLVVRDLVIDQNTTNNIVADPSVSGPLFSGFPRYAIAITGGMNTGKATIQRVRCVDTDGVNTITYLGRDVVIDGCLLDVSTSATDHDHSAIYTNVNIDGGSSVITSNVIGTTNVGQVGARTGIETHGGAQHVTGNTVRNYFKGGNVTGVEVNPGLGIHWVGNSFLRVRYGVQLWSLQYATNTGPYGLRNCHIRANTITLDPAGWTPGAVATDVRGVFLDTTAVNSLPFVDVIIDGNDIRTLPGHTGNAGDTNCHGIDWRRTSAPASGGVDRNIRITNNTITHTIASGVRVTNPSGDYGDHFVITGNVIRNPGQGTVAAGGGLSNSFSNGVMIVGQLKNSRVNDNLIIDDQGTPTLNDGLYLVPSNSGSANNEAVGNRVVGAVNKRVETSTTISGGWYVRMDFATYTALTGIYTAGSEVRDLATGTVYRQFTTPEGQAWASATAVPRRPGLAAQWTTLTNRPLIVPGTGTGTLAKDSWRYLPIRLDQDLPVDALAITTTVAATTGTAALIFGLFAADSTNRPGSRVADYSTYGSIDLTATAGVQQLATVGLTIPAGEWYLALAWTGTATGNPTVTTVTGFHPAVASATAVAAANAYLQTLSGGSVPASATPSTTATAAPLVHAKLR